MRLKYLVSSTDCQATRCGEREGVHSLQGWDIEEDSGGSSPSMFMERIWR